MFTLSSSFHSAHVWCCYGCTFFVVGWFRSVLGEKLSFCLFGFLTSTDVEWRTRRAFGCSQLDSCWTQTLPADNSSLLSEQLTMRQDSRHRLAMIGWGLDGFTACVLIKTDGKTAAVPVWVSVTQPPKMRPSSGVYTQLHDDRRQTCTEHASSIVSRRSSCINRGGRTGSETDRDRDKDTGREIKWRAETHTHCRLVNEWASEV